MQIINDWIALKEKNPEWSTCESIESYLEELHDIGMKVSTLWTILSPIKTFVIYTERGWDFYKEYLQFIRVMNQRQKKELTKKSQVFIN